MTKIEFNSTSELDDYFDEMMKVLDALEEVQEGWADSLLTDDSTVADFMMNKEELKVFKNSLGIKSIKDTDDILSVCKKIRKK
jgi:hypothetical protein